MFSKFSHDENAHLQLLRLREFLHNVNGVKVGANDAFSAVRGKRQASITSSGVVSRSTTSVIDTDG